MRCLKVMELAVFFILVSMSGIALAETHGKTDGCLVSLYNYPAETPQYAVSAKASPELPISLKKYLQASKSDEKIQSRKNLSSRHLAEKQTLSSNRE